MGDLYKVVVIISLFRKRVKLKLVVNRKRIINIYRYWEFKIGIWR